MEQVEEMCDHIVLINKGRNVLYGEVQEIKSQYKQNLFRVETKEEAPEDLPERFPIAKREKNAVIFKLEDESESGALLKTFLDRGLRITRYEEILPTFNEIFIRRVAETEIDA
jgi:ABC-2 type transport system ATP-binding protein